MSIWLFYLWASTTADEEISGSTRRRSVSDSDESTTDTDSNNELVAPFATKNLGVNNSSAKNYSNGIFDNKKISMFRIWGGTIADGIEFL